MIANPNGGAAALNRHREVFETRPIGVDLPVNHGDIHAIGRTRRFTRDQVIYNDGDDADHVYQVDSGVVRTCKFLRDGRRQVSAFHAAGKLFGLESGPRYSLSAAAASDCSLTSYGRQHLERLAATDEALSLQLFASALSSLASAQEHSLSLGCRSAVEKVAMFLIGYADYANGGVDIILAMTRKDIADYLGLTIETVSRTFSHLEHRALIELHGARKVRLTDAASLRELCA